MTPSSPQPTLRLVENVIAPTQSAAELADTYARQVDELAAMVEAEAERAARFHAVLAAALGEMHQALDEIQGALRGDAAAPASSAVLAVGPGVTGQT